MQFFVQKEDGRMKSTQVLRRDIAFVLYTLLVPVNREVVVVVRDIALYLTKRNQLHAHEQPNKTVTHNSNISSSGALSRKLHGKSPRIQGRCSSACSYDMTASRVLAFKVPILIIILLAKLEKLEPGTRNSL